MGGYLDNIKHFIFWLCNMKWLNFRHFNTNNKDSLKLIFFPDRSKNGSKKANIIFLGYQGVFGHFTTIPDYFRRFPKTNEEVRSLPKMSDEPSKHLTVFLRKQ